MNDRYRPLEAGYWKGRVDSEENFDAYRWHQWIKPLDLNQETTKYRGELGFAFVGFCCDEGVRRNKGRVGASKGPEAIRKEMGNFPCCFNQEVKLFDVGNIVCEDENLEATQEALGQVVEKILSLNLFPIVLGGGHEVALGHYLGLKSSLKKEKGKEMNLGIINFDAHFDIRPYKDRGSSGTMFRQIADICQAEDLEYSYMCLGVQLHSNTRELFKTAEKLNVPYILARDITHRDDYMIMEDIHEFIKSKEHIQITICSDVFSSAFAPGVSATQSLGLEPEKVLKLIKYILRTKKAIGFDIAEVSPRFDQDNNTANLAAVIIFSVINTLARVYDVEF